MPRSDQSRWWLAAEAALGLSLVVAPWSFGGAPWWTLWMLIGLGAAALLLWTIGAARNHRRWGFHPVLIFPVGAVVVSAFQLVPLPPPLLSWLSMPAHELREFALVPLGLTGWRPISLDPPSTARALARFVGLGSLLFVGLELGRLETVRQRLLGLQALVGLSIALTGLGHMVASAESLFGIHHFTATLSLLTPFGNTNHLAAYLALSATVALGLALGTKSRDVAIGWGAIAFICGLAVFLTFSRGGIVTFVATWALVGAAVLAQRGGGLRSVIPWVLIGATVLFAGLLAFEQLVARAETVSSVEKLRSTKVELWPMLWKGEISTWPLGMGAGAFELGFTRGHTEQLDVTFTHPENVLFQSLADWGLPLTVLLLLGALVVVRQAWTRVYSLALERTVLLGLVGVLLHDVFDFALELQAVAITASVLLGLVVGAGASSEERRNVSWHGPLRASALLILALVALWFGLPIHNEAESRLRRAISERRAIDEVRRLGVSLIDRHPSDWVLYADLSSDFALRADPRETLAWVNRLLFLRPNDARAHVAAGKALLRLGQPLQSLGEFKTAWALGDPSSIDLALAVAVKHEALDRVLVDREGHLTDLWQRLRGQGRMVEASALLDSVEVSSVGDGVRAEAAVLRVRQQAEGGDPVAALSSWDKLPEAEKQKVAQQLVRVALLEKLGRAEEALLVVEKLVARSPEQLEVTLRLVDMLAGRGRPTAARAVLERARPFLTGPQQRSTLFQREAALLVQEERWGRALEALQTAARIEPTRADLHYRMADILERMGSLHSALDTLRRGRLLDSPAGAKAQDANVARLEAAMAGAGQ
ncbi:MAG: O-antigen ligase family protein [Archangium sp.]|nr:O-antigen ligase family protein [Archangium sp.]MDP3575827.1 O-antigen ligase family protein [Archangium sp.]